MLLIVGCSSNFSDRDPQFKNINDLQIDSVNQQLKINTSEENREKIIKIMFELDLQNEIIFTEAGENDVLKIRNDFLEQEFDFFCETASDYLSHTLINEKLLLGADEKIIILYSSQYQEDINLAQTFYPKAKYVELPDNEFDTFIKKTFEIDQSLQRGNLIEKLVGREYEFNFLPRVREDFDKIIVFSNFSDAKNLVPSMRFNYILDKQIFISSSVILGVEKRNDLLDLENTFVAIPNQLLLNEENTVSTFKEKFTDAFLKDLIQIALLKETNFGNAKVKGNFGNINYLQNFCSDYELNIAMINSNGNFVRL